jgi:hypothetical protein
MLGRLYHTKIKCNSSYSYDGASLLPVVVLQSALLLLLQSFAEHARFILVRSQICSENRLNKKPPIQHSNSGSVFQN